MVDKEQKQYRLTCLQVHNDYLIPGGETKTAQRIADLLESYGIKVIRYYKSNESLQSTGVIAKVKNGLKSLFNHTTIKEVNKIIEKEKIDFALIHNVMPIISNSVYQVLLDNGIPIIKYIQNYNLICLNGALDHGKECEKCKKTCWNGVKNGCYKNSKLYSLVKFLVKKQLDDKYLRHIAAFMPNSEFVKNKHHEFGVNVDRMYVMYNFIDLEEIDSDEDNYSSYYLYFGRISQEKGVFTTVDAFKDLPDLKLIIMGNGECEEQLKKYIEGVPNIDYIGGKYGTELTNVIKKAKCVIVPSEWDEPLPRTILEAYACGVPVIGAERGGIPEMIEENITGYTFKAGNKYALMETVRKLNNLSNAKYKNMQCNCVNNTIKFYLKKSYILRFMSCLSDIGIKQSVEYQGR